MTHTHNKITKTHTKTTKIFTSESKKSAHKEPFPSQTASYRIHNKRYNNILYESHKHIKVQYLSPS